MAAPVREETLEMSDIGGLWEVRDEEVAMPCALFELLQCLNTSGAVRRLDRPDPPQTSACE